MFIYIFRNGNDDIHGINREDRLDLRTENSVQLQKFREKWYEKQENSKNLKIIPEDYGGLNENRVLNWYTGDGSYSGGEVSFATDGFREKDVRRISKDLNEEIGIHSHVNKTSKTNEEGEDQWKIRFGSKEDVKKFFKYLEGADNVAVNLAKKVFPQRFPRE